MTQRADEIAQQLSEVRRRIDAAARAAGRDPAEVTLVAVSKTKPAEDIRAAYAAGQRDFGENYAQELRDKRAQLADLTDLRWHFIGALQSNKVRYLVPGTALVHAVDRLSVAEALAKRAKNEGVSIDLLVEVNVGGEASKAGLSPDEVPALVDRLAALEGVRVAGLMCIPPPVETPDEARPFFQRLRQVRDEVRRTHPGVALLSMGMSDDFEAAVAEGATHVRVGTAIFGARARAQTAPEPS